MRGVLRNLGPAFGLGLLTAAGQLPLGAWYVALPALAVVIARVAGAEGARRAAEQAWAAGAGHFLGALTWIISPFLVEPEVYAWMAPFALILMAAGLALFWAAAGALSALVAGALGRQGRRAAAFVAALAGMEALRGVVFTGFPWALPGHIWIDTPVAQLAAWIGANGLTLLTLVVAALPVMFGPAGAALAALALAMAFGLGGLRLSAPLPDGPGLTFRLVQPNARQDLKWDPEQASRLYRLQTEFTAAQPRPDLVIWPETALPYLYEPWGDAAQGVARAARGVPVITGVQRLEGDAAYNSLVMIGEGGAELASYDKAHLVPFGEYIPFGDRLNAWFGLRAFAAQAGFGYAAGPGPRVLDLGPLGRAMPLICYEAVFPLEVNAPEERPGWLLQITNDAWFGTLTGPFQHAGIARLRAIEQGLPLVRVANTGVTQMVDARGQVTHELDFGIASFLDAPLPGALPPTVYHRFGEIPFLVLLAALCAAVILRRGTATP